MRTRSNFSPLRDPFETRQIPGRHDSWHSRNVTDTFPAPSSPELPSLETVLSQVRADAAAGRLSAWAESTLVDEHTGVPSFSAELFAALHTAAGISARYPVGNAGLIHVYGYWFSEVVTPFGLKRDRWADGALAQSFGRAATEFQCSSDAGSTLLERVSNAALPLLQHPPADALVGESAHDGRCARVVLHRPNASLPYALSYGLTDPAPEASAGSGIANTGLFRLVTTFPLHGDPLPVIEDFVRVPGPRWNAVSKP